MNKENETTILKPGKDSNNQTIGLGIDLGGTKIAGALFNKDGMFSDKKIMYLENRTSDQVGELILDMVQYYVDWAEQKNLTIKRIGVSVPGIYHSKTGKVWAPNIPGWDDYPLLKKLDQKLFHKKIEIRIDSDRACYILGGSWKGAAKGSKNSIFIAVGTGIGAGIMIDGKVLRGAGDTAGAIGWVAVSVPYQDEYRIYGCFESHASGTGIALQVRKKLKQNNSVLKGFEELPIERISTVDVFKAYDAGDETAKEVIDEAIKFWGRASANLVSLFNPEKIIFGGGVFGPATQFLPEIYDEAKKWGQPISMQSVEFVPSKFGHEAGLYGAGFLSISENE